MIIIRILLVVNPWKWGCWKTSFARRKTAYYHHIWWFPI